MTIDHDLFDSPLATFLRVERAKRKLSQQQAATQCGVHWRTWSMWETKNCKPTVDMCKQISDWAGISVGTFIEQILSEDGDGHQA